MEELDRQLEQFALEFNAFLVQRFPVLSEELAADDVDVVYADTCNMTIVAFNKITDIYLRWPRSGSGELVISRLHFKKREDCRHGHGTAIIRFIAEYAERFGISRLRIEDANHRADAFASKLGFTLDEAVSACKHDNDWIVDIAELR